LEVQQALEKTEKVILEWQQHCGKAVRNNSLSLRGRCKAVMAGLRHRKLTYAPMTVTVKRAKNQCRDSS